MKFTKLFVSLLIAVCAVLAWPKPGAAAGSRTAINATSGGTLTTLYSFANSDGSGPNSLILGNDGNLYGTTVIGGAGGGTVFKLTPGGVLTTLRSFTAPDGVYPSGIVQGNDGNFYGVTGVGGGSGLGTIFSITPTGILTVLYSFPDTGYDSEISSDNLIQGLDGNFYGTTFGDIYQDHGTVFRITPNGTFTIVFAFTQQQGNTFGPSGLIQGSDGNFYGTTPNGGVVSVYPPVGGQGTIFELTPSGSFSTIYTFDPTGTDGETPYGPLLDVQGALYGTAYGGGYQNMGLGTVFGPMGHDFLGSDGAYPSALVLGSDGNIYGTTGQGGTTYTAKAKGDGTIFELSHGSFTSLYSFTGQDGVGPSSLVQGGNGVFYGVTGAGGAHGAGTVFAFQLAPPATPTGVGIAPGDGNVTLAWSASVGATSYNIYRGTKSNGESAIPLATGIAGTIYDDTGVTNGTTYYYYLTALNLGGMSDRSFEVAAKPNPPRPDVPTNLSAVPGNGTVTLSWSAAAGATSYNVYRGTTSFGQSATPIGTGIVGTMYVDTGLTNGSTYFYRIAGFNAYGNSPEGNEAGARPIPPPAAPTNLTAIAGNTWASLSWAASAGATSYNVYRGTTSYGQSATPIASGVTSTAYSDINLTNGTTYYYRVAAFNAVGNSPETNPVSAKPIPPPAAPTGLTAISGNTWVTLTWTASPGATSYSVYRGTTSYGQSTTPIATGVTGTAYSDIYLTNGVTYYYRVAAFNGSGHSAEGNQVSAKPLPPPTAPTNLTVSPGNANAILSWTASANATSYNVYRGTTSFGQSATPVASGIAGTTYTDTGLTNGTTYYYRVAAFNGSGHSAEGNQAAATPVAPPPTPTGLTATAGTGSITLNWTASAGATSYNVYRGTTSFGQSATPVATGVVGTTYTNSGLAHGTTYFYRIAAFNAGGNSVEGNQASATP